MDRINIWLGFSSLEKAFGSIQSYQNDDYVPRVDYSELFQIINKRCRTCGKPASKVCSRCQTTRYCSVECQNKDWPEHKLDCFQDLNPTKFANRVDICNELVGKMECLRGRYLLSKNDPSFFWTIFQRIQSVLS